MVGEFSVVGDVYSHRGIDRYIYGMIDLFWEVSAPLTFQGCIYLWHGESIILPWPFFARRAYTVLRSFRLFLLRWLNVLVLVQKTVL